MSIFYLLSGIFLGWSLGANDAANVFGTAVTTKMVTFKKAAIIASIFVILGAVISGSGPTLTYGKLGAVNTLAGAFIVALGAGITVSWMTKLELPVSTTQGIVGAIVGWDIFSGTLIDGKILIKIMITWITSPILTAIITFLLFRIFTFYLKKIKIHLITLDFLTRVGLITIGAFGAYSLGANNIANIMGVFVNSFPIKGITIIGNLSFTGTQLLFLIGGIAISIGIFTYSHKVMKTIGVEIFKLNSISAYIVVAAESIVLFIFTSQTLESFLLNIGLPSIPLVPVSSSQAVVGGVVGIGIARGGWRAINFRKLLKIVWGWIITPIISGTISFFLLFFMQNVFEQNVYKPAQYLITKPLITKLKTEGIYVKEIENLKEKLFYRATDFQKRLKQQLKGKVNGNFIKKIIEYAEVNKITIDTTTISKNLSKGMSKEQIKTLKKLHSATFIYRWQLVDSLSSISTKWKFKENNTGKDRLFNKRLKNQYAQLFYYFRTSQ